MRNEYIKDASKALNTIWSLYKEKLTDQEQDDKWWSETVNLFSQAVEDMRASPDVASLAGRIAVACLMDIEDKSLKREYVPYLHHIPKNLTTAEFEEFLKNAEVGASVSVNGRRIEVRK